MMRKRRLSMLLWSMLSKGRCRQSVLLIIPLISLFLLLISNTSLLHRSRSTPSLRSSRGSAHYILQWNVASPSLDLSRQSFESCLHSNCYVTSDRHALDNLDFFDAILINADEPDTMDALPSTTGPLIVFSASRPPRASNAEWSRLWSIRFNMTISYKPDSDLVLNNISLSVAPPPDAPRHQGRQSRGDKLGLVAFWSDDCNPKSPARRLVRRLQQHIMVDLVDECEDRETRPLCSSSHMDNELMVCLNNNYKFLLSPEDVHCSDYISNSGLIKLLSTEAIATLPMVPIVWGGGDYRGQLPTHSFLDVNNFDTLEKLANELKLLDADDQRLNEYLQWRQRLRVQVTSDLDVACHLCHSFNNRDKVEMREGVRDVKTWWLHNNVCSDEEQLVAKLIRRWL